ncbi:Hsp20/alpha crystallin family protein [Candidatus Jorgensenbacteria bacterium]|nr:Hsp20/alpha crystallin family protein [Candidatus Jorgensenbacteria bacterium]
MKADDKSNMFFELAKVKSAPAPLKIQNDTEPEDTEGQLTVDVYQNKDDIMVQSTVAGVNPDDLEINITNESVTIRGKRTREEQIEDKDYFYQECFWGVFSRSVVLPQEVDPEKSTAALKNGVLTIRMPKLDRSKAKKLKVKTD